ncbi:MAG: hypothetical protein RLZZ15_2629 [Verrucomicrobiota bacterium]|jgi:ABC-type transport system involved in multi-copper enzyme maturation permease subunit
MSAVPFSPTRVALIAGNTIREAARQKLFGFFLVLALALVGGVQWFRDFNFGAPELKFLADFGFGAMAFFGAALTVAATAQLFFGEIEQRTALTLLAKPVWRAEFIFGKFLGLAAVAGAFCALLTALLLAVLMTREAALARDVPEAFAQGGRIDVASVLAAAWLQWLKLAVLAAFTLLVASFSQTQLFTVVMGFLVLVIGHLQYLAHGAYARAGSAAGRLLSGLIEVVFPNFQLFNVADQLGLGGAVPWGHVARVSVYGLGYIGAACALAVLSFRRREI